MDWFLPSRAAGNTVNKTDAALSLNSAQVTSSDETIVLMLLSWPTFTLFTSDYITVKDSPVILISPGKKKAKAFDSTFQLYTETHFFHSPLCFKLTFSPRVWSYPKDIKVLWKPCCGQIKWSILDETMGPSTVLRFSCAVSCNWVIFMCDLWEPFVVWESLDHVFYNMQDKHRIGCVWEESGCPVILWSSLNCPWPCTSSLAQTALTDKQHF